MRYLCPLPNPKALTTDELHALWAAGLPVGLVWENTATDYRGSHAQGTQYGLEARSQAQSLGFPDHVPIYWSVDGRLSDAERFVAINYGQGFTEAAGVARPYGEAALIDAAVAAGLADGGWCPETWGQSPHIVLSQLANSPSPVPGTDHNTILRSDWGGYHPGADMTPEEVQAAVTAALTAFFGDWSTIEGHVTTGANAAPNFATIIAKLDEISGTSPGGGSSVTGTFTGTIS